MSVHKAYGRTAVIMLVGDTRGKIVEKLRQHNIGRMWIDRPPTPYPAEPWGFDNGAFRDWKAGQQFNSDAYQRRLDIAYRAGRPYIAIVPDMVAQGLRSLAFSLDWLPRLPSDWPWYLAVQDGMTVAGVKPVLKQFAGLFLGGTDKFKATAWCWSRLAHEHGKLFHYGRAGTPRKIRHAYDCQADSFDSAFPLWTKERFRQTITILSMIGMQARLWGAECECQEV